MSEVMYRFHNYNEVYDIEEWIVGKHTPKGKWVHCPWHMETKKFVLNEGKKRYAYETKDAAFEAYKYRKRKQIKILEAQLQVAKDALKYAETGIHTYKVKEGLFSLGEYEVL